MAEFKILETFITCEYRVELPFAVENNSISLLSTNCSFIVYVTSGEIFEDTKSYLCSIDKNKLYIHSIKLEKSKAEEQMVSLADKLTKAIYKLLSIPKTTRIDKELFMSCISDGKIRLSDITYYQES